MKTYGSFETVQDAAKCFGKKICKRDCAGRRGYYDWSIIREGVLVDSCKKGNVISFQEAFQEYEFADGKPFGVCVEV